MPIKKICCQTLVFLFFSLFSMLVAGNALARTPLSTYLPEERSTRVECEYDGAIYHYDVYVPAGYYGSSGKNYPVIFIFSPGGNATMNTMEHWIKAHHWIAVMLVESRNGPWSPIIGNFFAAYDDVVERLSISKDMKILAGFSGGARACSLMALQQFRPGLHGIFLQGAGFYGYCGDCYPGKPYVYASFGDQDSNIGEIDWIKSDYDSSGRFFTYEVFSGTHQWAPHDVAERALDWLSTQPVHRTGVLTAPIIQLLLNGSS